MTSSRPRLIILSNVYDSHYLAVRREEVPPCLSSPKHRDLFRCIQQATGAEVLILSSPPRASLRRKPRWLPPLTTKFSEFTQLFCGNFDGPKIRIPLSCFFYAIHVARHLKRGDVIIMHNYYLNYVLPSWFCFLRWKTPIFLDYEDGRHLINKGLSWILCRLAELMGKPLVLGAFLAHPALGKRLSKKTPRIVIPGFYVPKASATKKTDPRSGIRFIYSGTLDATRGVDLLLGAIPFLPPQGWRLDISGSGTLENKIIRIATDPLYSGKVIFHSVLDAASHERLLAEAHIGLNPQRNSDPISAVTFPSKLFSYLSAGLIIISSEASAVKQTLGNICLY